MNGFSSEEAILKQAMVAACERVINSNYFVLSDEVREFEDKWASVCGTKHAIGLGNGLDAIEIAFRATGVGPGDEVITTPMTAFATFLGIIRAGAKPVLADIDPSTALLSIESVTNRITSRTKAILLVHLYGQVKDMREWETFCDENDLLLFEDCAQAHLAESDGRVAGSFGIAGTYSFYPTKNLGAIGDAGALVTSDPEIAERARRLRNYGQSNRYEHIDVGMNSRLDEIQAGLLNARLEWLDEFTARRREIAQCYLQGISNRLVRLLAEPQDPRSHSYHFFVVNCDERDSLSKFLSNRGVESLIHYPIPVHRQPAVASLGLDAENLVNSDRHAATCLSIPCHPQMTDLEVKTVISAINEFEF